MSNASDTGLDAVVTSDHAGGDQRPPAAAPSEAQPEYDFHPLCTAFPTFMGEDEFEKSMADYQLHPERAERVIDLAVDPADGRRKIVDGRHHYLLCRQLGYPVRTRELNLSPEDLCEHNLAKNLNRRHLTPAQKALALAATTEWLRGSNQHGLPVARRRSPEETTSAATQGEVAVAAGLGRATLARASRVVRQAPELAPAVRDNTLSLKAAEAAIALPPEDRAEIARAADPSAVAKRKLAGRPKARPNGKTWPGDDRPVGVLGELPPRVVRQLRRHGAKTVGDLRGQLARGVKAGREMDHEHRDLLKRLLADFDTAGGASPPPAADPPADRRLAPPADGADAAAMVWPPPGEPLRDRLGREVPDYLACCFREADGRLQAAVADLRAGLRKLRGLNGDGPMAGFLSVLPGIEEEVEENLQRLLSQQPHCVCPACGGTPGPPGRDTCPTCWGRGWLSQAQFGELPPHLAEQAAGFKPGDAWEPEPFERSRHRPAKRPFVPAGPNLDGQGRPIPDRLRDVFAGDATLADWARKCRRLSTVTKSASGWAVHLPPRVWVNLAQVAADLEDCRPYSVCRNCKGKGCEACMTGGWLPAAARHYAPSRAAEAR